jgi:hypothetical protein
MKHEGMVHALELIHQLLRNDGRLIDIHPVQAAPLIQIIQNGRVLFSEPSPGYDSYDEDIRHAEDALAQVVQRGLFVIEQSSMFDILTYSSSVSELNDYLVEASAFDETAVDQKIKARAEALSARAEENLQGAAEDAEIVFRERAHITRFER